MAYRFCNCCAVLPALGTILIPVITTSDACIGPDVDVDVDVDADAKDFLIKPVELPPPDLDVAAEWTETSSAGPALPALLLGLMAVGVLDLPIGLL